MNGAGRDSRRGRDPFVAAAVEALARVGKIVWGTPVLDIGCDSGRYTVPLALRTGAQVVGLDGVEADLRLARRGRQGARLRWVLGECTTLPFASGVFAACTLVLSGGHLDALDGVLREAYRVLAPHGGQLTILTTSHGQAVRRPTHLFPGAAALDLARWPALPALKTRMRLAGFQRVRHHLCTLGVESVPLSKFLRWVRTKPLPIYREMDAETFRQGLAKFRRRLDERFPGSVVTWRREHALVTGVKIEPRAGERSR